MRRRFITLLPVLLVAGCDQLYGVESRATLPGPVDVPCVKAALASIPGVGRVTYDRSQSYSTEILPKQRRVLTVAHDWRYGEGGADILEFIHGPNGWSFRNSRVRMGVAVPHDEIVRFVPLMQKVNRTLQMHCGLPVAHLKAEALGETKWREL